MLLLLVLVLLLPAMAMTAFSSRGLRVGPRAALRKPDDDGDNDDDGGRRKDAADDDDGEDHASSSSNNNEGVGVLVFDVAAVADKATTSGDGSARSSSGGVGWASGVRGRFGNKNDDNCSRFGSNHRAMRG